MNWNTAKGNWVLFKGTVKVQWSKLTHDHLGKIAGRRDRLTGKIQKTYSATKQVTQEQVKKFVGPPRGHGPHI